MPFCDQRKSRGTQDPRRARKKRHTLKVQLLLDGETREVIASAFGRGRTHDFGLFKESATLVHRDTVVLADLGYSGLDKLHAQTCLPS